MAQPKSNGPDTDVQSLAKSIPSHFRLYQSAQEIPDIDIKKEYSILIQQIGRSVEFVPLLTNCRVQALLQRSTSAYKRELRIASVLQNPNLSTAKLVEEIIKDEEISTDFNIGSQTFRAPEDKETLKTFVTSELQRGKSPYYLSDTSVCVFEEYFMNAVYDAPTNCNDLEKKDSLMVVGTSPQRAVLACEDRYGSFDSKRFLEKLALSHSDKVIQHINKGDGGAGIGNRFILENSSELYISCVEGSRTVFISVFEKVKNYREYESLLKNVVFAFNR